MDNDVISQGQTDYVTYWQPNGVQKFLAASSQNYVGLMEDGRTVLKYPLRKTQETLQSLRAEADRYARLGTHENLVTCKGFSEDGLRLEYCEQGGLLDMIEGPINLTNHRKTTIGTQIVRCLIHLHEHNFIHCDLHVRNVFLTSEMDAKVGDLQGQLFRQDGSIEMDTMSQENAKSRHPCAGEDEFSRRTDIFALGTLLYHLWYGHPPFPELDEHKQQDLIQERYRTGQYPIDVTQATGVDAIIGKCWTSEYTLMSEVLDDMDNLSGWEA
jgi:serine/threonine protein kinase